MNYYKLKVGSHKEDKLIPGMDADTVEGKEDFFDTDECGPNKFYDHDYQFNYLTPKAYGEPEPEAEVIADYHLWHGDRPMGSTFYPVSKRFKELLEGFALSPSKFYKAQVLFMDEYHPYFVWQVLMGEFEQYIDFDHTEFNNLKSSKKPHQKELKVSKFNSISDLKNHSREYWERRWNYERLVLKPSFREQDFCMFPVLHFVVSERLKEAIEAAELTGIAFEELPIKMEFSDKV